MKAMDNKPLIMIVEDDEAIGNFISAILLSNNYNIVKSAKGKEAISMTASFCPDIILLDLGLPDIDGIEVLKIIRKWTGLPIIIISARGQEGEKVEALDNGADDYITKPFGSAELLARIRTAMRHGLNQSIVTNGNDMYSMTGELKIDYDRRSVSVAGENIHLTPVEYKIIVLLAKNMGKVLTHDYIVKEVWGPYMNEIQALRVNMANIRRKIEKNPGEPQYIVTEVGVGYRMVDEFC
jgi:two-component system, OmpR family, KDP operon response regulator KdpE